MNVSRSHLVPNTSLREAFDEDLKSLKPEMQPIVNRLLKVPQHNDPSVVSISTCFYSGFMRWLSKFLGALHLELNSEDLERCKLSKSELNKINNIGGSSVGLSSSGNLGSSSESQGCLDKLEQIDPEYTEAKERDEEGDLDITGDGDKTDEEDDNDIEVMP